jgi:hypothetical protein
MASIPTEWQPMIREGGIAAESLYSGLTALRKANYAQSSLYNHAFFGITIGLERLAKLVILLDSRARTGAYPSDKDFRTAYGHRLTRLFEKVEEIRLRHPTSLNWSIPDRGVTMTALGILSEFAEKTRYYNINVLVGASGVTAQRDPIEAWYADVGGWALSYRYTDRRRISDHEFAMNLSLQLGNSAHVAHRAEDGTAVSTVYEAALRSRQMEVVQREGTFVCVSLARHISELLTGLTYACWSAGANDVPALHEFFGLLNNRDSYLRRRKTFSL